MGSAPDNLARCFPSLRSPLPASPSKPRSQLPHAPPALWIPSPCHRAEQRAHSHRRRAFSKLAGERTPHFRGPGAGVRAAATRAERASARRVCCCFSTKRGHLAVITQPYAYFPATRIHPCPCQTHCPLPRACGGAAVWLAAWVRLPGEYGDDQAQGLRPVRWRRAFRPRPGRRGSLLPPMRGAAELHSRTHARAGGGGCNGRRRARPGPASGVAHDFTRRPAAVGTPHRSCDGRSPVPRPVGVYGRGEQPERPAFRSGSRRGVQARRPVR